MRIAAIRALGGRDLGHAGWPESGEREACPHYEYIYA